VNPATGETLETLAEDDAASVKDKVARARAAQPAWAATPLAARLEAIKRFRDALVAKREELALLLTREMGKPLAQARNELKAMPGRLDFFLGATAGVLAEEVVYREGDAQAAASAESATPALEEIVAHEPLGVVANVSAWNYPYFVGSNVFVPALLTGNTVLYKPSELTSLSGLAMVSLLHEAGVPRDAVQAVIGGGSTGGALVAADVDGVFFTGSFATGRRIAEATAGRMIKVQLELGGKDPTYVCEDVDVRAAAESLADGAMYNNGQSCCSVERIYVHRAVYAAFVEAFVDVVRGFKIGAPEDESTYISALARPAQLQVLEEQVADAVAKGGRVLVGGKRHALQGVFEPTVVADATNAMTLMREESFGPVIGIGVVGGDDEAIRAMNDTAYGLTAGVYTRDVGRARAVLGRMNAGSVYWNCCDRVSPRLPWTGRKNSGMGSTLSTHGIRTFLQPKAWHLRRA
jgi:acyl-CoA reductase-like NAD-dependent aldehyde dehydrogenase